MNVLMQWLRQCGMSLSHRLNEMSSWLFVLCYEGSDEEINQAFDEMPAIHLTARQRGYVRFMASCRPVVACCVECGREMDVEDIFENECECMRCGSTHVVFEEGRWCEPIACDSRGAQLLLTAGSALRTPPCAVSTGGAA